VAQPSTTYAPGDPTATILYAIVREHFETFRAQAASLRDGDGLPKFVEQEFRDSCGAAVWPAASLVFGAPPAGSIGSSPSRARAAASARAAAVGGWRSGPRIWSITSYPTCRYANGS
jgi:hypothetical protein